MLHAGFVVVPGDKVAEDFANLLLGVERHWFGAPSVTDQSLRADAVALSEQRTAECKSSFRGHRLAVSQGADGGEIGVRFPQHRLGPAAEHRDVRPAGIGHDEGLQTGIVSAVVAAAEDCPFHQLAGGRIADPLLRVGCVFRSAAGGEADRVAHRRKIGPGDGGRS